MTDATTEEEVEVVLDDKTILAASRRVRNERNQSAADKIGYVYGRLKQIAERNPDDERLEQVVIFLREGREELLHALGVDTPVESAIPAAPPALGTTGSTTTATGPESRRDEWMLVYQADGRTPDLTVEKVHYTDLKTINERGLIPFPDPTDPTKTAYKRRPDVPTAAPAPAAPTADTVPIQDKDGRATTRTINHTDGQAQVAAGQMDAVPGTGTDVGKVVAYREKAKPDPLDEELPILDKDGDPVKPAETITRRKAMKDKRLVAVENADGTGIKGYTRLGRVNI